MHYSNNAISRRSTFRRVLENGGPGCCHFAVTSNCNAGCTFCGFSNTSEQPVERIHVPVEDACAALDILAASGIDYVVFTGGEPTTHPYLGGLLSHARDLGLSTTLCTNGWLLTADRIRQYVDSGLASVCISVDAPNVEEHEANRNLPGICSRIAEANTILREMRVQTAASVLMSRLTGDLAELPRFLRSLNFESVTFSYPQRTLSSTYRVFSDSSLVDYTPDELWGVFNQVKQLSKSFPVRNPNKAIDEMQRFVRGGEQRFPCLGGYKYFYLDWHLNVYKCFAWPYPMCSIWDFTADKLVWDRCVACMSDCFRDASVLHHIGMAVHAAARSASHGHVITAARQLANRAAYESIRALAEQHGWIRGVRRRRHKYGRERD